MWNEKMRIHRERCELSQKELSRKLGISERTLQRYEAGENEPTISLLLKLSKIYEISIDDLIGNDADYIINTARIERYVKEIEDRCKTIHRVLHEIE